MTRKFGLMATILVLFVAFGVVNMIYAQGPDDEDPTATPAPCANHPMWQSSQECPFADSENENWSPEMMNEMGCWMAENMPEETSMMPGRGMMGMGQRGGMMGMGGMMHNENTTMPHMDMMNVMMSEMMGAGFGFGDCSFEWDGDIPEEPTSANIGDAENGELLFTQSVCSVCHDTESNVIYAGPSLVGVGERAANYNEEMSAYSYLYQSIVDPNAYVVEGFAQGVMPAGFSTHFNEAQINDLIAYLMTLE